MSDSLALLQTIAGGSGAGPNWHGTSGIHTHITNTRIGDVEILERRYPVLLHKFAIRNDSAGVGKWRGGEGVIREFEVLQGLQMSILSEVWTSITRKKFPIDLTVDSRDALVDHMEWREEGRAALAEIHG